MKLVTLGKGCKLDIDKLIRDRLLINANSGGGKSQTVRKLCEITHGRVQQIIIDVDGEYASLREKFDYVLFGSEGDYPVDIKSAALLAVKLLQLGVSAIIDIYELGTQRALWIKRFLEALVNSPRDLWHPVLVVVDEAHKWAPEKEQSIALSAVNDLMTLGRKRGFAGVLATQRISKLSKDAAAECNLKLIGRSSLDIDRKRSGEEIGLSAKTDILALRDLEPGWFYAIGFETGDKGKALIHVDNVETTHLKAGQARSTKPVAASTKIKKVLGQLADLPHEVEEELRSIEDFKAKIKRLEAEARKKPVEKIVATKIETKIVEKSIVKPAEVARVEKVITKLDALSAKLLSTSGELLTSLRKANDASVSHSGHVARESAHARRNVQPQAQTILSSVSRVQNRNKQVSTSREIHQDGESQTLKGGPKAILEALIQYETGCSLEQLTVLTGYKQTSRYEFLRQLKGRGLAIETADGRHHATDEGRAMLPDVKPLPTGEELRVLALSRLRGGPKALLEVFIEAYPVPLTKESLMRLLEERGTPYKGTSIYEYTRQLAAHEVVEEYLGRGQYRASPNLFD